MVTDANINFSTTMTTSKTATQLLCEIATPMFMFKI